MNYIGIIKILSATVYGLDDEKHYCWLLRGLDYGGFEDAGSTLFGFC